MRLLTLLVLLLTPILAWQGPKEASSASDWRQFRGPSGLGVAQTSQLPERFGLEENLIWKVSLPPGHSSPVLSRDHIFVTAYEGKKLLTISLDRATGKVLWRRQAPRPREESFQSTHGPASSTPVTDGKNVYVFFGDFGIFSYGPDGSERWRLPLGPFHNVNGHGSSPILADGLLLLICDQDSGSFLIAVDQKDGSIRWRTDRPEVTRGYATPAIYRPGKGPAQVIVPGSFQAASYRLDTGEKLWWVRRMAWQVKCVPIISKGTIYINAWEPGPRRSVPPFDEVLSQYDRNRDGTLSPQESPEPKIREQGAWKLWDLDQDGVMGRRDWEFYRARLSPENSLVAIRPGNARGDLTDSHVLWRHHKALPNTASPLLINNVIFLVKDGGIVTSLDPASGRVLKEGRLKNAIGKYWASPVGAGDKVYLVSEDGDLTTLKARGDWEVLATSRFQEDCLATPAIADDRIYIRTLGTLYCFGRGPK